MKEYFFSSIAIKENIILQLLDTTYRNENFRKTRSNWISIIADSDERKMFRSFDEESRRKYIIWNGVYNDRFKRMRMWRRYMTTLWHIFARKYHNEHSFLWWRVNVKHVRDAGCQYWSTQVTTRQILITTVVYHPLCWLVKIYNEQ